jgi:soluble lytic murein transglycosylase
VFSPGASPAPATPTPTADASTLEEADRLYYQGYFEEALDLYASAAEVPQLKTQALWSLAVAQFSRGMRTEAVSSIDALLAEDPDAETERRAVLLLGVAEASRGATDEARQPLEEYIESGGPAASYAKLRLAQIAAKDEDIAAAIALSDEAIAEGLPPATETSVRFTVAGYHEDGGDTAAAIAAYTALADSAASEPDRAEALWKLAALSEGTGDAETARQALARIVLSYPADQRALDSLSHPALTSGVSTFARAIVLFEHRLNADAAAAFEAFLAESPSARDAANAHHLLGIISERFGDYDQALAHYDTAIALLAATASDSVAANAMWDRALVLHVLGRLDEAVGAYVALAQAAPGSPNTQDALFAAGLVRYQQGRPGDAITAFEVYESLATEPESIARAEYWLGKTHDLLGDAAGAATDHYRAAAEAAPADYYGMRARAVLDGGAATPRSSPDADPDWTGVETWVEGHAGPEDTLATQALFGPAWQRALELRAIGLTLESDEELIALRDSVIGRPWQLYRLARAAEEEGIDWLASRAGGILASAYRDPPPALLTLNYPLAFFDIASAEAEANGISPYLLLALVRQESLYDPAALSPAGAMGLTQVISSTAAQIASELGEDDFREPDLFRPHVSLRFGAYYLASTLESVGGSIPAALAGYNGGPGNAHRWLEQSGGDPDVFLEIIDFRETAAYVELVLENYALYQYAYGLVDTPSLAFDS